SWIAWARHADLEREIERGTEEPGFSNASFEDARRDRDSFELIALVSTSAGSALFAASMPFVLPERQNVPWWAWSVGVAGTAAAAVGTRLWLDHGELVRSACPEGSIDPCWRRRSELPLAPMLVTQGIGLLAVPLTYVVRGWTAID